MGMMLLVYLIGVAVLFVIALVSFLDWRAPRVVLATTIFLLGLVLMYPGIVSLTGLPKPVEFIPFRTPIKEARVLGVYVIENKGIYLLLYARELGDIPRYYQFPYSPQGAEELQKQQKQGRKRVQEGEAGDESFLMKLPFEGSLEDQKKFYPPPQPRNPPKQEPTQGDVLEFQNPRGRQSL